MGMPKEFFEDGSKMKFSAHSRTLTRITIILFKK